MTTGLVIIWFLCGLAGCGLHHALSAVHADMEKYKPVHIWMTLFGPVVLFVLVCIALSYALDSSRSES